jgi:hypothetical protein
MAAWCENLFNAFHEPQRTQTERLISRGESEPESIVIDPEEHISCDESIKQMNFLSDSKRAKNMRSNILKTMIP